MCSYCTINVLYSTVLYCTVQYSTIHTCTGGKLREEIGLQPTHMCGQITWPLAVVIHGCCYHVIRKLQFNPNLNTILPGLHRKPKPPPAIISVKKCCYYTTKLSARKIKLKANKTKAKLDKQIHPNLKCARPYREENLSFKVPLRPWSEHKLQNLPPNGNFKHA